VTHIPSRENCNRRGKLATACGRESSVRKIVTDNASCPDCFGLDFVRKEAVLRGEETIMEYVERCMDRGGLIRSERAFHRRRRRS
jgi:hypothetical protein